MLCKYLHFICLSNLQMIIYNTLLFDCILNSFCCCLLLTHCAKKIKCAEFRGSLHYLHITASPRLAAWWAPPLHLYSFPVPLSVTAGDEWASSGALRLRPPPRIRRDLCRTRALTRHAGPLPFLRPPLPPASVPPPQLAVCRQLTIASSPGLRSPVTFSVSGPLVRDPPRRRAAVVSGRAVREEQQQWGHAGDDDGEDLGEALGRTRELVECAMFAAVAGLAYFLSTSLAIENYFSCFFPLPIVISSLRWGLAAGRKAVVATVLLLFTLSGPVKASNYLLMHGVVGLIMGTVWRLETNWIVSIILCSIVRALGACGYVLLLSFLTRENILALITVNIYASLTYILAAAGVNSIPSMNTIYVLFGTLLLLNCAFFVFLLHVMYTVFLTKLGIKPSLRPPRWLNITI